MDKIPSTMEICLHNTAKVLMYYMLWSFCVAFLRVLYDMMGIDHFTDVQYEIACFVFTGLSLYAEKKRTYSIVYNKTQEINDD